MGIDQLHQRRGQHRFNPAVLDYPRMQVCARQIPFFVRAWLVVHIQRIESTFPENGLDLADVGANAPQGIDMPRKCFAR